MPTSAIDSLVFRNMFGDREVRQIWSDEYRTQCYVDWEAALARAQAGLGLIPQDAATEINRVCKVENIDFSRLEEESLNIGYPVLGVVHQICHLCRGDAGNWCHWGATAQDVTDSATVFQIRASFDIVANKLDEAIAATANLARDIAARVADIAGPGSTLVSSTVRDLVAGSGLRFEDRGRHALKGLPEDMRIYAALHGA
jgi:3-carboxy-cis,cis-muconate cycloisomerase